jgi:hypothetical protein
MAKNIEQALCNLRSHKWSGCMLGGPPDVAESHEWVRYCAVCGMEDTCEDDLPPCPGPDLSEEKPNGE